MTYCECLVRLILNVMVPVYGHGYRAKHPGQNDPESARGEDAAHGLSERRPGLPRDDEHDGSPAYELNNVEDRREIRPSDAEGRANGDHGHDAVFGAEYAAEGHEGVSDDMTKDDGPQSEPETEWGEESSGPYLRKGNGDTRPKEEVISGAEVSC